MNIKTCIEILSNSDALIKKEFVLSQEFFTNSLRLSISDDSVKRVSVLFRQQHCILDFDVGKAGLLYRWVSSLSLRAADFNSARRFVAFEQVNGGRVGPANFPAKAIRFAPILIPDVSLIISRLVISMIDELVSVLVHKHVTTSVKSMGLTVDGNRWVYDLTSGDISGHPAFTSVWIPFLGSRPLVGGVVVVKRLDLVNGAMRLKIGLHPDIMGRLKSFGPNINSRFRSVITHKADDDLCLKDMGSDPVSDNFYTQKWHSIKKTSRLINRIGQKRESKDSNTVQPSPILVDPNWVVELDSNPVLDVAELGIEGIDSFDILGIFDD